MGKHGKKQKNQQRPREKNYYYNSDNDEQQHNTYPVATPSNDVPDSDSENEDTNTNTTTDDNTQTPSNVVVGLPSKFSLYQQSVQSPKGDISYLRKFFLMYVGGRVPLHLQEDFCGTALLSAEWLCGDTRRTAVGLDFDVEALNWCLENNLNKFGSDLYSRISLFHGNVLHPLGAELVETERKDLINNITKDNEDVSDIDTLSTTLAGACPCTNNISTLPPRDIVCAFNYSCCCLHSRQELISYFKYALSSLSKKGGIFVMDLYGGTSSECELKLQRRFPNFTYVWEQTGFDILQRKTRISLHYNLQKPPRKIRHAFSYEWRLWSLPEIRDCLEEAGFKSVHFWIRQMPDSENIRRIEGFGDSQDVKYEEVTSFQQQDSWNAYIVGVV
ncbi:Nuclear transcription factor Y subunit alpha like [Heracleum sosnowskyi]|uniref:Nuclear transcription factor Y subunit alpha like n=1 Tax=Heracleum sosnowskyi TaxID=360622 RepID=A0AAD8MRS6_9APIA|nr:Nuclear transcription factor Y subunit alpha like [Heracleum sosnowskyi]